MIKVPRKKVAVVPIFDSKETRGGIIKATTFNYKRDKWIYEIYDTWNNRKLDEAEDIERARYLCDRYNNKGLNSDYRKIKIMEEDQPLDSGERCDQGIVKYIGLDVHDTKIGDYVFFSGYTGTLLHIEGEGTLIIMPEDFVICSFNLDKEFIKMPGIYFRYKNNEYFEATYEEVMNVITSNITDLGLSIDINSEIPKYEDYNVR